MADALRWRFCCSRIHIHILKQPNPLPFTQLNTRSRFKNVELAYSARNSSYSRSNLSQSRNLERCIACVKITEISR